jgi:hypothetical protein
MKSITSFFSITILALLFTSCKKNDAMPSVVSKHANTPTCAYLGKVKYTGADLGQYITFMDLSSNTTAEKKYFTIKLKYVGVKDSFEVVTPPQTVDSIAAGFPAEIKEYPGYGLVNQWTNPEYRLLTSGGNSYYKDTIVRNPQSNYYNFYLNFLSGPVKEEWPQSSFDNYRVPIGTNGQVKLHYRTIFYFNKGLCFDANNMESGVNLKNINTYFIGAPNFYDWQNVDAAIQIQSSGIQCNFYFFDFKNWQYFKWEQFNSPVLNNSLATTFYGYESLDTFCKWPEGWGKK